MADAEQREHPWSRAVPIEIFTGPYTFCDHTFEVLGTRAPILSVELGGATPMVFPLRTLLWHTPRVRLGLGSGYDRHIPGERQDAPARAWGEGQVAISPGAPGKVFMLYLPPEATITMLSRQLLCAVAVTTARQEPIAGMDRTSFSAGVEPGLLILVVQGDAFELMLDPAESMIVQVQAVLYNEPQMDLQPLLPVDDPASPISLLRCAGPGLIALQTAGYPEG